MAARALWPGGRLRGARREAGAGPGPRGARRDGYRRRRRAVRWQPVMALPPSADGRLYRPPCRGRPRRRPHGAGGCRLVFRRRAAHLAPTALHRSPHHRRTRGSLWTRSCVDVHRRARREPAWKGSATMMVAAVFFVSTTSARRTDRRLLKHGAAYTLYLASEWPLPVSAVSTRARVLKAECESWQ